MYGTDNFQLAVVSSSDQIQNVIVSRHASAVHKTMCVLVCGSLGGDGGADSSENRGRWDRRTKCDEVGDVSDGDLRMMVQNRMFRNLIL